LTTEVWNNHSSTVVLMKLLRFSQQFQRECSAAINRLCGHCLPWVTDAISWHISLLCCSLDVCKRAFYRATNSIFGKIGRTTSKEVFLQLVKSKCMPVLLCGLEAFLLYTLSVTIT